MGLMLIRGKAAESLAGETLMRYLLLGEVSFSNQLDAQITADSVCRAR
jgi:hypothetical protein